LLVLLLLLDRVLSWRNVWKVPTAGTHALLSKNVVAKRETKTTARPLGREDPRL
jgi:hypothetical protein